MESNVVDIRRDAPFQSMTNELTDLLIELCRRHRYDHGLTRDELRERVRWQLVEFFSTSA